MTLTSLEDLLVLKLASLYDIESEILKAFPKMIKHIEEAEYTSSLENHLEETKVHKQRLEQIFGILSIKPKKVRVEAIRGLIEDALWMTKQTISTAALDSALAGATRSIEHYEIAGYSTASMWARRLGYDDIADLLDETLQEEDAIDGELIRFLENADVVEEEGMIDETAEE